MAEQNSWSGWFELIILLMIVIIIALIGVGVFCMNSPSIIDDMIDCLNNKA